MGLHHRMGMVGRCVSLVQPNRRGFETAIEIPDRSIRLRFRLLRIWIDGRILAGRQIELPTRLGVPHLDQCGGRPRLFEAFGDDERNGLVIVLDLRAAE